MEKVYKYGRGNFKSIEEGNELIWMIGNGIGGFSNHTVAGGGAQCFHGYLVASLNPPVNRTLILTRNQELIEINGREYDLTSQQYIGSSKNGQEYLERFTFDSIPEYMYMVEDISIRKTIAIEYGHNTVAICYEIENGMDEAKIRVFPLFNYRQSTEVSEKNELKFDINLENRSLSLIPNKDKDREIKFYSSEGEFYDRSLIPTSMATPNYVIEENHFYMIDHRTGFLGVDNHYTPYEVQVNLKPFEKRNFMLNAQ